MAQEQRLVGRRIVFSSTRNPVGQRPPAASNRAAIASAARSPGTGVHRGLNGRTDHIAERHDANWHRDWDRRHAHFVHNRFFVFDNGFWFGLDAGFFPWDYLPYYAYDYYPYDYYTDVQPDYNTAPANAYPYDYYTGVQPDDNTAADNTAADNGAPVADTTVQAVQTEARPTRLLQRSSRWNFRSDDARCRGKVSDGQAAGRNRESFAGHAAVTRSAAQCKQLTNPQLLDENPTLDGWVGETGSNGGGRP